MQSRFWLQCQIGFLVAIVTSIVAIPGKAEKANFKALDLAPGFTRDEGIVTGYTGGAYSLSTISNRDQNQKICTGFADTEPDHILTLEGDFDQLKIVVDSGGHDTTLLIKGLDNTTIRCDDSSKDATLSDGNWKQGRYLIWVGTFYPNVRLKYTLTAEEPETK